MKFVEVLNIIMNSNTEISALADYIFLKRVLSFTSEDKINEAKKTLLVYDYRKTGSVSTRDDKDYLQYWDLDVYIGSPDYDKVYDIARLLQTHLESYKDTNIRGISFEPDWSEGYDNELKVYFLDAQFKVIYTK